MTRPFKVPPVTVALVMPSYVLSATVTPVTIKALGMIVNEPEP